MRSFPAHRLPGILLENSPLFQEAAGMRVQLTNKTPVSLSSAGGENQLISTHISDRLHKEGMRVFLHSALPPNDGGIALGQLTVGLSISGGRVSDRILSEQS